MFHLAFLLACNPANRLKTLCGLTPHEFVCAQWQVNPPFFTRDPTQLTLGLYTLRARARRINCIRRLAATPKNKGNPPKHHFQPLFPKNPNPPRFSEGIG